MKIKEVRPSHADSYERQCHESGAATSLASHYFQAVLPRQFDEYCWFDRTSAVQPLETARMKGMPETYPFGL